eukprot:2125599-Prymnesium_polylepis.1
MAGAPAMAVATASGASTTGSTPSAPASSTLGLKSPSLVTVLAEPVGDGARVKQLHVGLVHGVPDSTHSIPYRFVSTCSCPRGYIPGACMLDVWKPGPG